MPSDSLSSGILALVWNSGPIAKGVLVVLMVFSIVSWALIVEKAFQFRRVRRQTLEFLRVFREARRTSIVHTAARRLRQSPLAQLYSAAYQEVSGIPEVLDKVLDDFDEGLNGDRLEAVNRALRRASALEVARLEHYLPFLATTASATPFIGLFGTVWGVMAAFHGIGAQGSASLAVVAPGISEALVATAAGLGAAIPAVIGYNYFVNRVKHWAVEMEGFTMDLLNVLSRPVAKAGRTAKDGV
ncbi:MAG TPA: MotA/TolQ/ExbB proton channel family protein [Methylomirabilota bacterium]|nr:MotA/TolQ/ExbB proton channel family protein [Methylomirabilota bacterium]